MYGSEMEVVVFLLHLFYTSRFYLHLLHTVD